jgi:hypothetical protein
MSKTAVDVTTADIERLCELAKCAGENPDDEAFIARMREQLLALNRGHAAMYRELRRKREA